MISLALAIIGLICIVVGVVALVNASYIAGAILVFVGLVLLAYRTGGLGL